MIWKNLLKNKCPECSCQLLVVRGKVECSQCEFRISEDKFSSLCSKMVENNLKKTYDNQYQSHQDPEENLMMLNNL